MNGNASQVDRYSTWEMDEMVSAIDPNFSFLNRTFFATEKQFTGEFVEHDIVEHGRRVAPFVSPLAQGKSTRRTGYRTYQLKPGYIKLSDTVRPQEGFTRLPGEPYGGTLDPIQRVDTLVAQQIATHFEMIDNRLELMARDALFNGKIVISDTTDGADYPQAVVDFERNPLNDVVVATAWNAGGATPLRDIQNHAATINQTSRGAVVNGLLMCSAIFDILTANQQFRDLLNTVLNLSPGTSNFETGPRSADRQERFRGTLAGQYEVWTYDGYFDDDTGAQVPIMPSDRVLFVANQGPNSGIEGRRLQGAILDMDAGIKPQRVFVKARNVWDPSGVEVLTQSAPMVSLRRPNASGTLKVVQ